MRVRSSERFAPAPTHRRPRARTPGAVHSARVGCTLALLVAAAPGRPSEAAPKRRALTVALLHDERLPEHREFATALVAALDHRARASDGALPRVVALDPGAAWAEASPPRAVVALGDEAAAAAAQRWPDTPQVRAWTWAAAPAPNTASLTIAPRAAAACTAERLRRLPGAGAWRVVAAPHDHGARSLAAALDAGLVQGDARTRHAAVAAALARGERVFLRADAELASVVWLDALAALAALSPGTLYGDAVGLTRWHITVPVTVDVAAAAEHAVQFITRAAPRGEGGSRRPASPAAAALERDWEAPCRPA